MTIVYVLTRTQTYNNMTFQQFYVAGGGYWSSNYKILITDREEALRMQHEQGGVLWEYKLTRTLD